MKNRHLRSLCGIVALTLFSASVSYSQTISTIAGTGASGMLGDGGAATLATMTEPHGLTLDGAGNLYVADAGAHVIRKISPSGVITRIAGTGTAGYNGDGIPATAAQINNPFDLIVDESGTIYFGETAGHRVRKISPTGIISTVAGNGTAGFSGDGGLATAARVSGPGGVLLDPTGNLYIADGGNHRVRKISPAGIITTIAGTGFGGYGGDGGPATAANIYYSGWFAMDAAGNLYVSDNGNHRIRKIDPSGIITTAAGNGIGMYSGDGGPATAASIYYPGGIDVDALGNLYIADCSNHRIRKVSPSGIITTFAGTGVAGFSGDGGPAIAARFNLSVDVEVDDCGKVYVADLANRRIRKIATNNRAPSFNLGATATLSLCANKFDTSINSRLAVVDSDQCQTETWSLITGPAHGSLTGLSVSTASNGGLAYPAGITYTPVTGYAGHDTLKVQVSDGVLFDTIVVYVNVDSLPDAGSIVGKDSVCLGKSITLSGAVAGGTWSSVTPAIGMVSAVGVVSGTALGTVSIRYTVSNPCGSDTATHTIWVHNGPVCKLSQTSLDRKAPEVLVYPNPNNGSFTIKLDGTEENATGVIHDVTGRKIKDIDLRSQQSTSANLDLTKGVYYLSVQLQSGVIVKKIVVGNPG